MGRAARRRDQRRGGGKGQTTVNRAPLWIMGGSVAAALLIVGIFAQSNADGMGHHPTPRLDAHAMHLMPPERYASSPYVAETYAMAAEMPGVMDGIFCFCFCRQNFGHYSLLDCFKDDHGANCDVCLNEAVLAYEMTQRGDNLEQIRAEIDRRYRT